MVKFSHFHYDPDDETPSLETFSLEIDPTTEESAPDEVYSKYLDLLSEE